MLVFPKLSLFLEAKLSSAAVSSASPSGELPKKLWRMGLATYQNRVSYLSLKPVTSGFSPFAPGGPPHKPLVDGSHNIPEQVAHVPTKETQRVSECLAGFDGLLAGFGGGLLDGSTESIRDW
jgi:hypothetical protein